jgi:hypothetical protein
VNDSPRTLDKIANGQYLAINRADYDALGGHALVKDHVAEDLMLAQKYFASGRKTVIIAGTDHVSTRMYTSLSELNGGWRKNVYAGGREAMPGGRIGQFFFPLMLLVMPLAQLIPVTALLVSLFGIVPPPVTLWATITTTAWLAWWTIVYTIDKQSRHYALCFPIGAAVMAYIFVTAIARGHQVAWKGRNYANTPATNAL